MEFFSSLNAPYLFFFSWWNIHCISLCIANEQPWTTWAWTLRKWTHLFASTMNWTGSHIRLHSLLWSFRVSRALLLLSQSHRAGQKEAGPTVWGEEPTPSRAVHWTPSSRWRTEGCWLSWHPPTPWTTLWRAGAASFSSRLSHPHCKKQIIPANSTQWSTSIP